MTYTKMRLKNGRDEKWLLQRTDKAEKGRNDIKEK